MKIHMINGQEKIYINFHIEFDYQVNIMEFFYSRFPEISIINSFRVKLKLLKYHNYQLGYMFC